MCVMTVGIERVGVGYTALLEVMGMDIKGVCTDIICKHNNSDNGPYFP